MKAYAVYKHDLSKASGVQRLVCDELSCHSAVRPASCETRLGAVDEPLTSFIKILSAHFRERFRIIYFANVDTISVYHE